MNVKGFTLVNQEKVNRAIYGAMSQGGRPDGSGVGEKAKPEALLAAYDRLGGLITKDGQTIKTGCFYDFENKQAFDKPVVVFLFKDLDGETVEIEEGEEIPLEVKAAEKAKAKKAEKAKAKEDAKAAKKGAKGKKDEEEEVDEEEAEEESDEESDEE